MHVRVPIRRVIPVSGLLVIVEEVVWVVFVIRLDLQDPPSLQLCLRQFLDVIEVHAHQEHIPVAEKDREQQRKTPCSDLVEREHRGIPRNILEKQRSEEHTSELQSLMRISYAVFCLKTKTNTNIKHTDN